MRSTSFLRMMSAWALLLSLSVDPAAGQEIRSELEKIAALPGEPRSVSAAGVTRSEKPLITIENTAAFSSAVARERNGASSGETSPKLREGGGGSERRLVIVAGLDGDERSVQAALGAVTWFKTKAPQAVRRAWSVSALPFADPEQHARAQPYHFPPEKGFFDHPEQPESRYVWRWVTFQSPDLVLEIRGGDAIAWQASGVPSLGAAELPSGSLAAAISGASIEKVPAVMVTARGSDGPQLMQRLLAAAAGIQRSPLHTTLAARSERNPLDIARVLANRYPQNAIVSYIPSVAWTNTLRLAAVTNDLSLRQKVHQQTMPWLSGDRTLFGDRISLTAAAGTMIYAELAEAGEESARGLAIKGAEAVSLVRPDGIAQYGQGWTDDMFMSATVLARTGRMPGRQQDLDRIANLLISYAGRLQREDGIFVHFTDGRQPWGRGNGFAALGLMEALTSLPPEHASRAKILEIYRRQMNGMRTMQAPDGMWRQVVDQPGSYREESVTAMTLTAMARGIRRGWLDQSYRPVVERAWRALAAHIGEDGSIVDVCTGTGAGPTRRYYFDRAAITGFDDRGGAMALLAAMEVHELAR
jgi:unsaturated rhamnogalacturonyl hydrolase